MDFVKSSLPMLELQVLGYFKAVERRSSRPPVMKIFGVCSYLKTKIILTVAIISCFITSSCSSWTILWYPASIHWWHLVFLFFLSKFLSSLSYWTLNYPRSERDVNDEVNRVQRLWENAHFDWVALELEWGFLCATVWTLKKGRCPESLVLNIL